MGMHTAMAGAKDMKGIERVTNLKDACFLFSPVIFEIGQKIIKNQQLEKGAHVNVFAEPLQPPQ